MNAGTVNCLTAAAVQPDPALNGASFRPSRQSLAAAALEEIYGLPPALQSYVHPVHQERFSFMDDRAAVRLAKTLFGRIKDSGFGRVVVLESGATPMAEILVKIARREKYPLAWDFIKVPRGLRECLAGMVKFNLSAKELNAPVAPPVAEAIEKISRVKVQGFSRAVALEKICPSLELEERKGLPLAEKFRAVGFARRTPAREALALLLNGTSLYERFSRPFLLFDEYITGGSVLSNAQTFLNLVSRSLDFKVGSYMCSLRSSAGCKALAFTLYRNDEFLKCFRQGAYPYENRPDLAGAFYLTDHRHFRKISLQELRLPEPASPLKTLALLTSLRSALRAGNCLAALKEICTEREVRDRLNEKDLLRYALYLLEAETRAEAPVKEFLWQLFDMYGPPWSPLPVSYHKDYWLTFSRGEQFVRASLSVALKELYLGCRAGMVSELSALCLKRRRAWQKRVDYFLDEEEK